MRYTDIAIVGRGLAGSSAAAMLERARSAEGRLIERRRDFRAARSAGERTECRPAPYAWYRTADRQRLPFHYARLRHRAGRPREVRVCRADLLSRAILRPHGLSD